MDVCCPSYSIDGMIVGLLYGEDDNLLSCLVSIKAYLTVIASKSYIDLERR